MNKFLFTLLILSIFLNIIKCDQTLLIRSINKTINFSDFLGIGGEFSLFSSDIVSQQLTYIKQLPIGWVRIGIPFDQFESTEGVFNLNRFDPPMRQLNASGLNTIVYFTGVPSWFNTVGPTPTPTPLDPSTVPSTIEQQTQFAQTLLNLAKNYTFVKYWQVWDKMNDIPTGAQSYDPQNYLDLYQEVLTVFKSEGLQNKLSIGSVLNYGESTAPGSNANFITDLLSEDGAGPNILTTISTSSFQPYTTYPEGNDLSDISSDNSNYILSNNLVNKLKSSPTSSSLVFSSEWGWSSDASLGGEVQQANNTIKRLLLDTVNGVDKSFLYTISDLDTNSNITTASDRLFGIVNLQLGKKLVYRVLERLFQIIGTQLVPPTELNAISTTGVQPGMVILLFKKPTTNTFLIVFYKNYLSPANGGPNDPYTNVSTVTLFGAIPNGGNKENVGYLYTPINVNQSPSTASAYQVISYNKDGSFYLPVSHDLSILEFPLPPPKNNSDSSSDQDSNSLKLSPQFSILIIFTLSLIFQFIF
ncbi:glycosidase superfamily protein [Dictyostelium discoideum AX4]|uniref:Glycosidase superfamily protein n=1 Tax=Dictyostelium discoideum TaxID=44689 RepID=Q54X80_DICDI|nr:glycosidase superfamily protein [Dictyostelium discoideum AX4]EAL67872.1 glycosidase superfamily protein [Dictyostelium discoideum AX4]|eukprot:XP_641848.1 glycosidase superfamily protein [Dictyostelium discoideum AX4]